MHNLKEAVEELVQDKHIKARIEEYYKLHTQLTDDDKINTLKKAIQKLYDYTYGGKPLGGYPACELCDPF